MGTEMKRATYVPKPGDIVDIAIDGRTYTALFVTKLSADGSAGIAIDTGRAENGDKDFYVNTIFMLEHYKIVKKRGKIKPIWGDAPALNSRTLDEIMPKAKEAIKGDWLKYPKELI